MISRNRTAWISACSLLISSITLVAVPANADPVLHVGDRVQVGAVGVYVPSPGHGVEIYADAVDGSSQWLSVTNSPAGIISVQSGSTPSSTVSSVTPLTGGECGDSYNGADNQPIWHQTVNWYFHSSTTPAYLSVNSTESSLRDAVINITHENNNCGWSDNVSASSNYAGRTSNPVQVNSNNTCDSSGDGSSVIGFGPLSSGWLGATCNWNASINGSLERVESDTRLLADPSQKWTNGSCSGQFSVAFYVEGITTHEKGHTWNVTEFPAGHMPQTMGGANGQCPGPDDKETLGSADMISLEANYHV
jgi:hypothetical protein